ARRATVTNERSPVPELRAHLDTRSEDGPDGRGFVGPKAPRPGGRTSSGRGTGPSRRRGTEGTRAPGRLPRPARRQERKSAPDLRPGRGGGGGGGGEGAAV